MKNENFHQRKISRLFKLQEFSPPCTWHSCLLCLTIPTIFKTTHLQILTMQLFKCKTILSNQLPSHNTKDFGKSHVYYVAWWTHEVCSLQVKALIFHYFYFCDFFFSLQQSLWLCWLTMNLDAMCSQSYCHKALKIDW
jgi:hypothetical protein